MSDELSESLAKQDLVMLHQTFDFIDLHLFVHLHVSLRTRGESVEDQLFDFQQIASEVMEAEEKLIEEHKAVIAVGFFTHPFSCPSTQAVGPRLSS
jgi:hypothetical protein